MLARLHAAEPPLEEGYVTAISRAFFNHFVADPENSINLPDSLGAFSDYELKDRAFKELEAFLKRYFAAKGRKSFPSRIEMAEWYGVRLPAGCHQRAGTAPAHRRPGVQAPRGCRGLQQRPRRRASQPET